MTAPAAIVVDAVQLAVGRDRDVGLEGCTSRRSRSSAGRGPRRRRSWCWRTIRSRSTRARSASCARSLTPRVSSASSATCACTGSPAARCSADDVGEVLLALRVVGADLAERLAQRRPRRRRRRWSRSRRSASVASSASLCSTTAATPCRRRARPGRSRSGRSPGGQQRRGGLARSWCVDEQQLQRRCGQERGITRYDEDGAVDVAGSCRGRPAPRARCRPGSPGRPPWRGRSGWRSPASRPWPTTTSRCSGSSASAACRTWPSMVRPRERRAGPWGWRCASGCPRPRPGRSRRQVSRTARGSQLLERIVRGSAGISPALRSLPANILRLTGTCRRLPAAFEPLLRSAPPPGFEPGPEIAKGSCAAQLHQGGLPTLSAGRSFGSGRFRSRRSHQVRSAARLRPRT